MWTRSSIVQKVGIKQFKLWNCDTIQLLYFFRFPNRYLPLRSIVKTFQRFVLKHIFQAEIEPGEVVTLLKRLANSLVKLHETHLRLFTRL